MRQRSRLGADGKTLGCREIQRGRIAPNLADDRGQRTAAQTILHRPKHIGGARQIDHDNGTVCG
jgi:hypothetical protein